MLNEVMYRMSLDLDGILHVSSVETELRHEAVDLIHRSRRLLDKMHAEDREEAAELERAIESAVAGHDQKALAEAVRALRELLFFVEGD